jgi:hypothetical protein
MATKPKPRWGWDGAGTFPPSLFSEDDFKKIAKIIGVENLNDEIRSRLTEVTQKYFIDQGILDNAPRNNEIKAALKVVEKRTKDTAKCLNDLDLASMNKLIYVSLNRKLVVYPEEFEKNHRMNQNFRPFFWEIPQPPESISPVIERCLSDLKKINQTARQALIHIDDPEQKDTGGPTKKRVALRCYILGLKGIFEDATGKKAPHPTPAMLYSKNQEWDTKTVYYGPFFGFVSKCLKMIGNRVDDSALLSQIKSVFLDT